MSRPLLRQVLKCVVFCRQFDVAQSLAALGKDMAIRPRLTSLVYCLLVDPRVEGHLTPRRPGVTLDEVSFSSGCTHEQASLPALSSPDKVVACLTRNAILIFAFLWCPVEPMLCDCFVVLPESGILSLSQPLLERQSAAIIMSLSKSHDQIVPCFGFCSLVIFSSVTVFRFSSSVFR